VLKIKKLDMVGEKGVLKKFQRDTKEARGSRALLGGD